MVLAESPARLFDSNTPGDLNAASRARSNLTADWKPNGSSARILASSAAIFARASASSGLRASSSASAAATSRAIACATRARPKPPALP